jgi:hypothetical protein
MCQKCFFLKKDSKGHVHTHAMEIFRENDVGHVQAKCDTCGTRSIVGNRYICNVCFHFTNCEKCVMTKAAPPKNFLSHKPYHTWTKIRGEESQFNNKRKRVVANISAAAQWNSEEEEDRVSSEGEEQGNEDEEEEE